MSLVLEASLECLRETENLSKKVITRNQFQNHIFLTVYNSNYLLFSSIYSGTSRVSVVLLVWDRQGVAASNAQFDKFTLHRQSQGNARAHFCHSHKGFCSHVFGIFDRTGHVKSSKSATVCLSAPPYWSRGVAKHVQKLLGGGDSSNGLSQESGISHKLFSLILDQPPPKKNPPITPYKIFERESHRRAQSHQELKENLPLPDGT